MFRRWFRRLLLPLAVLAVRQGTAQPVTWQQPMDMPPDLAGTFGEIRAGHFHSGIDLRTGEETGYPVRAADTGWVSRIRTGAYGFGKAVYIDHPTGFTTVYAHLDRFEGLIADSALAEQRRSRSFETDFMVTPGRIPVGRGEVIGYSGNTGASEGPHLHFEIRDRETQEPVDPLGNGMTVRDTVPPQIIAVRAYGYVQDNGRLWLDTAFDVSPDTAGASQPVAIPGTAAWAVCVHDFMGDSTVNLGVSSLSLWVDDQLVFTHHLNRFNYDDTRYAQACVDAAEKAASGRLFILLHRLPGNKFPGFHPGGDGLMHYVDEAVHRAVIRVTDFSGLTAERTVAFTHQAAHPAVMAADTVITWDKPFFLQTDSFRLDAPDMPLTYFTHRFALAYPEKPPAVLTRPVTLGDPGVPVHRRPLLSLRLPAGCLYPDKTLIVQLDSAGRPSALRSTLDDGWVSARIGGFGTFALMADTTPPRVKFVSAATDTVRKALVYLFSISDDLSGIAGYDVTDAGQWVLAEYDAKAGRLACFFEESRQPGAIHLTVTDRAGNIRELDYGKP